MAGQPRLRGVGNDKGCDASISFHRLHRAAEVVSFEKFKVELIVSFEHAVQSSSQFQSGDLRLVHLLHHLSQFLDRSHTNFVPFEVVLLQFCEDFVRSFVFGVFQAACVQHVLHDGPISRRLDQLKMFLGDFE